MRNILALIGAFTISGCSGATAVACGQSDNTTVKIFDWGKTIQNFDGVDGKSMTAQDFLNLIGKNLNATQAGNDLYKSLVDYTALSVIKTNKSVFKSQYDFAILAVQNQIKNYQNSLQSKYGRSWEGYWRKFLDDPSQGGDGTKNSGSVAKWTDVLLKAKATDIIKDYYVSDNYHDFSYYSPTEISYWIKDMYQYYTQHNKSIDGYDKSPTAKYPQYLWVVAYAIDNNPSFSKGVTETINNVFSAFDKQPPNPINLVPKTIGDKKPGSDDKPGNFVTDSSKTINGLLSDQQLKIAKIWTLSQAPVWTKQIVFPFDKDVTKPLSTAISADNFKDSKTAIDNTLQSIANNGFETALNTYGGGDKTSAGSSASGDLGLKVQLASSDTSAIEPAFQYYVYRYVLSQQGAGKATDTVTPYNLPTMDASAATGNNLQTLISKINRSANTQNQSASANANEISNLYNDEVVLTSKNETSTENGQGLATFIDKDGLHIVQTRGITYQPKYGNGSITGTSNINTDILNFNRKVVNKTVNFNDAELLTNRVNGLSQNSYLSYLQSYYLMQKNTPGSTQYFDLNSEVSNFVGSGTDIKSNNWWDYLLYSDNNANKINWNSMKSSTGIDNLLGGNINPSSNSLNQFVDGLQTWFLMTKSNRWSDLRGNGNVTTFANTIVKANKALDDDGQDAPPARMDAAAIANYITNLGKSTLWWYDPNDISG